MVYGYQYRNGVIAMVKVLVTYINKYGFVLEKNLKVNNYNEVYKRVNGDVVAIQLVNRNIDAFTL